MSESSNAKNETLYDRIGGALAVEKLIDDFYERILADPELAPFFANSSVDNVRTMQREFFAVALDGESSYTGRPLSYVHHGRGIQPKHFQLFVGHLAESLDGHDISKQDMFEIIDRINSYVDEVVGSGGGVDG